MAEVSWTETARAEWRAALSTYGVRGLRVAADFEAAIERAAEFLADFPLASPLVDDRYRRCQVRRHPYGLIYRMAGDDVVIVAVAHDRRSPNWAGR